MVRCAATAASWLLAANLALPFSHGVALEAAVATGRGLKEQEEVAEVIGDSKSDDPIWSLPEAIAKATGEEPITEWKEYLFKDGPLAFGEKEGVGSTAAIFPPRTLAENGGHMYQFNRNSGGGGVRGKKEWWPPITCPYGGAMQVEYYAQEQCIGVGQGLCKDGWQFGIRHYGDNTYLMLWREDNPAYPVVRWFPGATSLCIGEQYPNVAYLRITYDDCLYYLIGPGAGSAGSLARLKIAANTRKYKPDDVIVKFRDGPGDQNTLLQIFANGFSRTSSDAMWYPLPCETASPSSSPSDAPGARMGFDDLAVSPTEPTEHGKAGELSHDQQIMGRAGVPEERIVPDNAADNSVVLFPEFDVPQLIMGSTFCEFEIDKPKYTEEQKQCVKSRMDTDPVYEYIDLVQSEEFTLAMKVILVNPVGLPKLSFLNFAKAFIALLCGGSGAEALNKAFGIETVLKILEFLGVSISTILGILLSPLSLLDALRVFSWIPKIGTILGKISKLVRPAYKKMNALEKQADEKCEESGVVLNFINKFFSIWGQIQFGIAIFLFIDGKIRGTLCDGINAQTLALLTPPLNATTNSGGGVCYDPSRRLGASNVLDNNPTCSLESVLSPVNTAIDSVVSVSDEVNSTINTLDDAFQVVRSPIEDVLNFFADNVYEPLKPFIEAVGTIQPVFDTVKDVIDNIPTCEICNAAMEALEGLIEEALDAFGFDVEAALEDFVALLGFPEEIFDFEFDIDMSNLEEISKNFADAIERKKNETLALLSDIDISGPLQDALNCNSGDSPYLLRIVTTTEEQVQFTCPANSYPITASAVFSRYDCNQDMTAFFRFPCNNDENTCDEIFFGDWVRCPLNGGPDQPEGVEDDSLSGFSPSFFRAVFYCVPFGVDPNIVPVLRELDTSGYQTPDDGSNIFPIMKTQSRKLVKSTTSGNHFLASPLHCTNERTIEMDSWAWLPKTCYASGFSPADIYEKDFCAEEYNEFLVSSRPNFELASSYIQDQISSRMHRWREKDAYEYTSISYQEFDNHDGKYNCFTSPCECAAGYVGSGNFCATTNRVDDFSTADVALTVATKATISEGLAPRSDNHGDGRMLSHGTTVIGHLCGGLDSTTPVCSRTANTEDDPTFRYCGSGKKKTTCTLNPFPSCSGALECSIIAYYGSSCSSRGPSMNSYLSRCPSDGPDPSLRNTFRNDRVAEYNRRSNVLNTFYNDIVSRVQTCDEIFRSCNGQTTCDLSATGCENDYVQYACVDSTPSRSGAVVHNFKESKDRRFSYVYCPVQDYYYMQPVTVKCEIGSGFEVQDCASVIDPINDCGFDDDNSWCKYSVEEIATRLGNELFAKADTIRVETICACPQGFQLLPNANGGCTPCDDGQYRNAAMEECVMVPEGFYSVDRSLTPGANGIAGRSTTTAAPGPLGTELIICPEGTYSATSGANQCTPCPPGTFRDQQGGSSLSDCTPCTTGYVAGEGATVCTPCSEGKQPDIVFQITCEPCPTGTFKSTQGGLCTACEAGTFSNTTGLSSCYDCKPGTYQHQMRQSTCIQATVGFFTDSPRATELHRCPEGTTTNSTGSMDVSDCLNITIEATSCPDESLWKDPKKSDEENCAALLLLQKSTTEELGNGICQTCYNIPECRYDGGDCCPESCVRPTFTVFNEDDNTTEVFETFPNACNPHLMQCLAPRNRTVTGLQCLDISDVSNRTMVVPRPVNDPPVGIAGNGFCDLDLNVVTHNYDGGDCCQATCDYRKQLEKGINGACQDDWSNCIDPDGFSDSELPVLHNLPESAIAVDTSNIPGPPLVTASDNDPCLSDVSYNQTFVTSPDICIQLSPLCLPWNGTLPDIYPRQKKSKGKKGKKPSNRLQDLSESLIGEDDGSGALLNDWDDLPDDWDELLDDWEWDEGLAADSGTAQLHKGALERSWSAQDTQNNTATFLQTINLVVSPCEDACLRYASAKLAIKQAKNTKYARKIPRTTPTLKCEKKCLKVSRSKKKAGSRTRNT